MPIKTIRSILLTIILVFTFAIALSTSSHAAKLPLEIIDDDSTEETVENDEIGLDEEVVTAWLQGKDTSSQLISQASHGRTTVSIGISRTATCQLHTGNAPFSWGYALIFLLSPLSLLILRHRAHAKAEISN